MQPTGLNSAEGAGDYTPLCALGLQNAGGTRAALRCAPRAAVYMPPGAGKPLRRQFLRDLRVLARLAGVIHAPGWAGVKI